MVESVRIRNQGNNAYVGLSRGIFTGSVRRKAEKEMAKRSWEGLIPKGKALLLGMVLEKEDGPGVP